MYKGQLHVRLRQYAAEPEPDEAVADNGQRRKKQKLTEAFSFTQAPLEPLLVPTHFSCCTEQE